ncbi:MAG: glycosyltransferase family 4 protein [Oscillospiraceae bacterium]|nr:glycosyltransferase family 4 protein [Oscillospiraceae bacterium]
MNILMLTPVFDTGGTETYIENLSIGLKKLGHSVMVASGGGIRVSHLTSIGITHIHIKNLYKKGLLHSLKSVAQLTEFLRAHKTGIIHTSSVYTTLIAKLSVLASMPFRSKKPRIVLTLHGGPTKDIERKSAKILKLLKTDTIAITNISKNSLIRYGMHEEKLYQIYNGVDIERFKKLIFDDLHHEFTQSLRANGKIILGFFGRLSEEKGVDKLVKAMKIIMKSNKNIVLIIVGEGHCKKALTDDIKSNGLENQIYLTGFQHNPYAMMNDCDLIILPSVWDTAPMVILEAMALGKNVIANNVGGISELLEDTGKCVSPKIHNFVQAILDDVKAKKHLKFNRKGQKRIEQHFSLEEMVKNTQAVYFKLTNQS